MTAAGQTNSLDELRAAVCQANRDLVTHKLVILTWGNVSGITADRSRVVIKPSGVPYEQLTPEQMVVVDLEGRCVEGTLRPSTDTPTHLELYRAFPRIGGITHTHSRYATTFAQARREIPCLGTTHADHFHGPVRVTRSLTAEEVRGEYERNTGRVIVERMAGVDVAATPGVLVAGHGPFTWGSGPAASLENAVALEAIAEMAYGTLQLNSAAPALDAHILDVHHERKHGRDAYYGQSRG